MEIFSHENRLKMSLSERDELSPSFKSFSETPFDSDEIERFCQEIINILNKQDRTSAIGQDSLAELKKAGQLLYDHLFTRTVKDRLRDVSGQDLILAVDERLVAIPWELLYDGGDFLCLKFNLGRSIRTESEINPHRYRELFYPFKMLILANPTGDLRSSYEEGLQIKNFLIRNRDLIVSFKSHDVDSVYVKKNLRDYDIVHFAGHCEYDTNQGSDSGWLLSDGRMGVSDFILMAQTQPLPSMIFANACQSAKMPNLAVDPNNHKYIYNLAYAFLFSGVRHFVGACWRLDDRLGFEFAKEFYAHITKGRGIGEALRLARIGLVEEFGMETVAWANYILYGDPGFILSKPKSKTQKPPFRKILLSNKKVRFTCLFTAVLLIAGIFLYNVIPSLSPNAHLLYYRARRAFLKGENPQVINLAYDIIKNDNAFLAAYLMLGDVSFRLGDLQSALRHYFDYLRFSEKKKDAHSACCAYLKIAWCYHMEGDYQKAEEFYMMAIDSSRKNKDYLHEADGLGRMAVWNIDKGNLDVAFGLLLQSSEINRQRQRLASYKFNLACDYFNIAFLFVEQGDLRAAKDFYEKSFKIFLKLREIPELSDYYFNMGEIFMFEKKYQEALDYYSKGLEIDKRLSHFFNLSSDYQMLGELYYEMEKFTEAERYFRESAALCKRINNLPVLASVYYDLGLLYKRMGIKQRAREFMAYALQIYKNIDTPDYQKVHQEYLAMQ